MPRPASPWVTPGRALAQSLRAADPTITNLQIAQRLCAEIPGAPVATHVRLVIKHWEEEGSLAQAPAAPPSQRRRR